MRTLPFRHMLRGQLVRSTATYAIADVINKGIPFILLPVIAHYLAPADYGVLTNFSVLVQILMAVCALNTYSALTVSYFNVGEARLPGFVSNLFYLTAILAAGSLVLVVFSSGLLQRYLVLPVVWQVLALFSAWGAAVVAIYLALLRMQLRAVYFGAIQIGQSLISAVLTIVFVVYLQWSWQGRALSMVIAAGAAMAFCVWSAWRSGYLFSSVDRGEIRNAVWFGLPLLPHTLSFWIKTGFVKIIITNEVGLAANGIFAIALTLGSVVGVFTDAFFSAYAPSIYKDLSSIDAEPKPDSGPVLRHLVRNTYRYAGVLAAVCIAGWASMHFAIPILFRGDYVKATALIPLVFLSLYFDGLYSIVSTYVFYRRKTKVLGAITFLSSLLQVTLAAVLVRPFGLSGALYAACFVSLLTFLAVLTYANRLYDLPWRLRGAA